MASTDVANATTRVEIFLNFSGWLKEKREEFLEKIETELIPEFESLIDINLKQLSAEQFWGEVIQRAIAGMVNETDIPKRIILLTNSEDNFGSFFESEALRAGDAGIPIDVIAVDLDDDAQAKARAISDASGGNFHALNLINDETFDMENLQGCLAVFLKRFQSTSEATTEDIIDTSNSEMEHSPEAPEAEKEELELHIEDSNGEMNIEEKNPEEDGDKNDIEIRLDEIYTVKVVAKEVITNIDLINDEITTIKNDLEKKITFTQVEERISAMIESKLETFLTKEKVLEILR